MEHQRRVVLMMGLMASMIIFLQTLRIPSRNDLSPHLPTGEIPTSITRIGKLAILSDRKKLTNQKGLKIFEDFEQIDSYVEVKEVGDNSEGDDITGEHIDVDEDGDAVKEFSFDGRDPFGGLSALPLKQVHSLDKEPNVMNLGMPKASFSWPVESETLSENSNGARSDSTKKKKKKQTLPPVYMSEMNQLLVRNRAAYHAMRPRWSSPHDKEILAVKAQIENASIVKNDEDLYAPVFRNISTFKRSYELMERMLKVYVYKEGRKPIFHQPLLKGLYASEGWFMKLMESNKAFVVSDPRKANMFYIPFSSRLLQFALYVRNSHNRKNLEQFLQDYVNTIAAKYPFWNRTGGADHFIVACHDWAPYETSHAMSRSIRALCVADLHFGFRLGKDVSLPETYVRSAKHILKDLGGKPSNQRTILAFYAGNMHGTLRPILLQHWENKSKDMKIFGPLPASIRRNMTYIQYMKSSKYCICPRGYEVNSPRVMESIFYECVPVIISDNFVPPFFEVLNWEAFSVILPEKDVPRLKEILLSFPEEKYIALQLGVRKVQQHFLWHNKPVKYDLFHMILHSIWYNRVYQIRTRSR